MITRGERLEQGLEHSRRMGSNDALVEAYLAAEKDPDASPETVEWLRQYGVARVSRTIEELHSD